MYFLYCKTTFKDGRKPDVDILGLYSTEEYAKQSRDLYVQYYGSEYDEDDEELESTFHYDPSTLSMDAMPVCPYLLQNHLTTKSNNHGEESLHHG